MQHAVSPKRKRSDAGAIVAVVVVGILVVLAAFVVIPRLDKAVKPDEPPYWPTDGWQTSPPEAQGFDSAKLAQAMLSWREQDIPIHSLLVIRNGYRVADATFYPYDGQSAHDVASVTKSVMTTLVGIAVDQGLLSLDDKMVSYFPDRTIANLDARKEAITVRQLVSMSSGLQCIRDGQPNNSVGEMYGSQDFVQYALDRPMASEPGSNFLYCSPAIHLLSPILQQATGMTALEFAQKNLFEPLGITDVMWKNDPQGYYNSWGDLSLNPQDMAKLGLLFLQQGEWNGRQIVSSEWVEEATAAQMVSPDDATDPYGYGWWVNPDIKDGYYAVGRLGQYIIVYPEWDMILVTTAGGIDIEQIDESLMATLIDTEKPLPFNPEGVAQLEAAVTSLAQPPPAKPVPALPDMARTISGQTYLFEPNPIGLATLAFEFDGSALTTAQLGPAAENAPLLPLAIGLDGLYRFTTMFGDGRPVGVRGNWLDSQTFVLDYYGAISNEHLEYHFRFQGTDVVVTIRDLVNGTEAHFGGHLQES